MFLDTTDNWKPIYNDRKKKIYSSFNKNILCWTSTFKVGISSTLSGTVYIWSYEPTSGAVDFFRFSTAFMFSGALFVEAYASTSGAVGFIGFYTAYIFVSSITK